MLLDLKKSSPFHLFQKVHNKNLLSLILILSNYLTVSLLRSYYDEIERYILLKRKNDYLITTPNTGIVPILGLLRIG